ncbi:MAG: hypothetical protein HOK97_08765 [Deltaproteobacteria bacterium]|nr:hypothetical protein [Deltaproteobacteria bacterium]MBT6489841.1 hypothetical protein [Deltaproteobacteria bacterium]
MSIDDFEPIELPKRDLKGLYIGLLVLVVSVLLYSQRENFPMILEGRYVPFVGEVYSFPGEVNPATQETSEQTLEVFNKPWVEMFLVEQKARNSDATFDRAYADGFVGRFSFDPTLQELMRGLTELMPFEIESFELIRHQFELVNRYLQAANLPVRIDAGLSWAEKQGRRKLRYLPGIQQELGKLGVDTTGGTANLLVMDRLDNLSTGSSAHGVAYMERMEGWLILESMRRTTPQTLEGLKLNPPIYWIPNEGSASAELMQTLGAWMAEGYLDAENQVAEGKFLLDLTYGVAIHEARHLADAVDEPVLTEEGKLVFGGFTPRTLKSLLGEVRAYLSQVIECPECTANTVASMAAHLPKRAAGSRELYGAVAHYVLTAMADPKVLQGRPSAAQLLEVLRTSQAKELFQGASDRAHSAYVSYFGAYRGASVSKDEEALKVVRDLLVQVNRQPSCKFQSYVVFLADQLRQKKDYKNMQGYFEKIWSWQSWRCRDDVSRNKIRERYTQALAIEGQAAQVVGLLDGEKKLGKLEQKALNWARLTLLYKAK